VVTRPAGIWATTAQTRSKNDSSESEGACIVQPGVSHEKHALGIGVFCWGSADLYMLPTRSFQSAKAGLD
jgi:hypothetical protein